MRPDDGEDLLTQTVADLQRAAAPLDGYGGIWIDRTEGRVIHVGVSGTWPTEVTRRLRSLVPDSQELVLTEVTISLADLEALHDRLTHAVLSDPSFRAHLVELGLEPQNNAVRLTMLTSTPQETLDRVAEKLAAPGLVVESAPEGYRTD